MDKKSSIFREKSLDRISSPEQLDDYVKATTPGVWVLLGAIMIFLAGFITFCVTGTVDTQIGVVVYSDGQNVTCFFDEADRDSIEEGMKVHIADADYDISTIDDKPVSLNPADKEEAAVIHMLEIDTSDDSVIWACKAKIDTVLPKDTYTGYIVVDSVAPYTFVTN